MSVPGKVLDRTPLCPILALAWVATGCTKSTGYLDPKGTGTEADGLAAQFTQEADALVHLLGFGQILVAALVLAVGWAAVRIVHHAVVLAWRMGLDDKRRLAPLRSAIFVIIVGGVGYLLLRRFLVAAPVITLAVLAFCSGTLILVLAKPIQNVWAGFLLSFRRRVREGDRVTVGGQVGIVRDVGLTRLHLRCADGAALMVPNHVVLRETLRVEQAKNTVPVTVRVPTHRPDPGPDIVRTARRSALLSPFRAPGTAVEVTVLDDGAVEVTMLAWSERAVHEAGIHLDVRLRAALAPAQDKAPASGTAPERSTS